eukprot:gene3551-3820_t
MHAISYSTGNVPDQDPIRSLVRTFPSGCLLLRDSLAASAQFLLPWLTAASLQQGDHVVFVAAAHSPAQQRAALKKIGAPGVPCRLVLVAARDTEADADVLAALAARAHVVADVAPLEGRTAAVDGSLTVTIRQAPAHGDVLLTAGSSGGGEGGDVGARWLLPGTASVWFFRAGDTAVTWLTGVQFKELMT